MMAKSGAMTDCDTSDSFPSETQDASDLQFSTLSGEKKNGKIKVLEEEKNKLAEQNKELHSQLQSHLENESSMSLQLDVLSNKLTVAEGEMCLLQNENHSLISNCEKMKTDMDHVLQKHREELEVHRAKCLKEKQEEVALLEDQLEQTLQQHDSVLKGLECKFKVLEQEKNELAEQKKELHSQLQSRLKNDSLMSLQLDILSNKLTVTEGEMCLLQNENHSLISNCEKMKTDMDHVLQKHREELEVHRAECLKEKQEKVALLEDQLEQTLQQHDSVLRGLERKFKVLEEEKNELTEQLKELHSQPHSQLQLHLEDDSSVSQGLLVLSNKLTVTEGEMCLLQNANHSLISDLEKMKTDMDHVLLKHREELEVLHAKCLKEKQEEVALLEDQLEQTLQQHDSVLRELEGRQREKDIIAKELEDNVVAFEKVITSQSCEIEELRKTLDATISGNLGGDNSASVANRVERLTEQIQLRRALNEQVSYMLSECEKNKASLQTLCDITVMLQEKLQVGVCEFDLAETVRYLLDTKDQVEGEVTLDKSNFESCAEHEECLPNQIKHLEDTNSELKADFASCQSTLCDLHQQKNALERSLGKKLTALSAEMSTVLTKTAEWKSKYQASEKLVANYEEQVASLRKVKLQLNAIIDEGEDNLQKTYEESKELKIKIGKVVGETEKVRKAMCVDCEDTEHSKDLMLQYRKVVNFFKMKNDNIREQVKVVEQKSLKVCKEKETMAVIISDLGEEVKSLQVSLQEKDEEVKDLISELAITNHFLSELKSEFHCTQTRLSGTVEETSEKLHKACLEKEMLSGENKKLLSEIEMLKQAQLVKCKKEADDQEVLAAKVKTLNGELEALKQKLHEQSTEISELKFQREELLKDFDQLRRKNKVLESKDEEYSKMSETNKCLNDLVKELKKQVIEIKDENRSAFEKLDFVEKAKAEVEEEWISKCRTCSHKIEGLCEKVSQINNVLLGSCTDKHHLCDDKQSGRSISEVEEKNGMHSTSDRQSDRTASWNSVCDHFELLNAKFAEFSGNVEVAAQRKEAVEKHSAADCNLERCQRDIDDWRNVYKKVESFISDVMTEMNFRKSLLKSIRGDDRVLNPKGCEDSLMRDLHQIKEHLHHACKKNSLLELKLEIFEKRLSKLKDERQKISEEYEAEKKKNWDGTSQVFLSTVKIEKLTHDVQCLEKANCWLEEEACALRTKVCNLKRRQVDFQQNEEEVSRKLEILSSEIKDLLDNNKHLKQENQTLVKEVNANKACDRETQLLQSNITSLRLKVAEYESEIMQLKAEKQQSQALQCMDSSDMTVNLSLLRLFPNPAASSMRTTCDNFTEEIKNDIAAILQILCIGNLSSPPGKQIQLIKDKVTSLLKNSSDNLQLARQIYEEVLSGSPALVGKSLSSVLCILQSKLKEKRGEVSVINRNICNHVQSLSCFIRDMCERYQLSKSKSSSCTAAIAKIIEQLCEIEQTDTSHMHESLSSVDRTLQNDVLPLLCALGDQASRDADSSVQKLLIQVMQKVRKHEAEFQALKRVKENCEVGYQLKTVENEHLEKICEDLRQELADKNEKENKNPLSSFVQKKEAIIELSEIFCFVFRNNARFSLMSGPLIDSYNSNVSTASVDEMCKTILSWLDQHCSLVSLRPGALNLLRHLRTTTDILYDPSCMPEEATRAVTKKESR